MGKNIEAFFTNAATTNKSRTDSYQKNEDNLTAKMKQFEEQIDSTIRDANRNATNKVEQIATTYNIRFHNFQIDVWVQTLQRQPQWEAEIIEAYPVDSGSSICSRRGT